MRELAKQSIRIIAVCIVSPLLLLYFLLSVIAEKDNLIRSFSQFLSLIPGTIGVYLRAAFYRFTLSDVSANAVISFATLVTQQDIDIGSNVYIGPQCNIGKCAIGKDTLIGSGVHIMSGKQQHDFTDINTPIRAQGGVFTKISVGNNCWLGNGALVMANIGDNSIIAAGSVVINDIPACSIAAGNPAKVIKQRD